MKVLALNPFVRIAPLRREHAANMLRWMSDPDVARNVGLRQAPSRQKTLAWIRNAARDKTVCAHAIFLARRHVGNVVVDKIDAHLGTARLSIYIGEADGRCQGVATTATHLALKKAFRVKKLHKVWLTVHARHAHALAAYAKFGFVREGILRGEFWLGGRRINRILMSLLQEEFNRIRTVPRP